MNTIQITLDGADLSDAERQSRVRQLTREIEAQTDARTALAREEGDGTTKGDPLTIGAFLVTFMTSGAAVATFNVVKSWIERDRIGRATLKGADGTEITISGANLDQIETLFKTLGPSGE